MDQNPKISIVIPVYNGSNYLAEAIESALAQTYSNIEVLVVNDGSTDQGKTDEIIHSYGDKIRHVTKSNGGVASALNVAICNMTGDYFSWLSHDDLYYPEKIEKQVEVLNTLGQGKYVIYSNYSVFTEDSEKTIPVMMDGVHPESFRYWLTVKNCLHGCTLLVPRTAFQELGVFDESLRTTQDYDLWFRIARKYNFVHTPEILVKARSHEKQDSLKVADIVAAECDALLTSFVRELTTDEIYAATKKSVDLSYDDIASSMWNRGFRGAAKTAEELANRQRKSSGTLKHKTFFKSLQGQEMLIYFSHKLLKCLPPSVVCTIKQFIKKYILKKGTFINMSASMGLKSKFTEVYDKNLFAGRKSRSGEGSDHVQTEIIRREIPKVIKDYNIKTFLDAPCGDWYWMSQTNLGVEKYVGVDIVNSMIEKNQEIYGNSSTSFKSINLTTDPLPSCDLIFSRDCLVHLSYEDALNILKNFKKSGAKYLLTTTFTNREKNSDLIDEHGNVLFWRTLNMQLSPFNFPEPILLINEGCTEDNGNYTDKCLGLWLLSDIKIPE